MILENGWIVTMNDAGSEHRRGQVLGIRVDGVAEQHQLDHRDADHHAEGEPIALELDEFLQNHGSDAPPETFADQRRHWMLSLARFIRPMNTSSSDG